MNSHDVFARRLLSDFSKEISGGGIEVLEGVSPESKFLVGMLSSVDEVKKNKNVNDSSVMVSQLGMDLFIPLEEINSAVLSITLQGDLFYRTIPTLAEQRRAFIRTMDVLHGYTEDQLLDVQNNIPDIDLAYTIKTVPVYHRLALETVTKGALKINLAEVYDSSRGYGVLDENSPVNTRLQEMLDEKTKELSNDPLAYRKSGENDIALRDVLSEENWQVHCERAYSGASPMRQNWRFYITCDIQKMSDDRVRVSVKLVNGSKHQEAQNKGRKGELITERVTDLFNAGLKIDVINAEPLCFELDYFLDDYKYDREQYALGSGCSVKWSEDHQTFETTLLPVFEQYRLKTRKNTEIAFDTLINDPVKCLLEVEKNMRNAKADWENDLKSRTSPGATEPLTVKGEQQFKQEISDFENEINRFAFGIHLIECKPIIRDAFICMNRAFKNSAKGYSGWRLFQIVFIVSVLPDIAACDETILSADEKVKTHLQDMDLLYFPTGGGKTEAFLGVLVFNLFFDRMRGKSAGVTAILKYPLRLLSVQQVQRVADILASAEKIRLQMDELCDMDSFAIGYYVGDGNTPNSISPELHSNLVRMPIEELDEQYKVIDRCPFCGKETVHIRFDETSERLFHYCADATCTAHDRLPLYIVDTDAYRYLPSVMISTIDKMATIGFNRRFKHLLGVPVRYCPIHGYHELGPCDVTGCSEVQEDVTLYDGAPSLFIQDELHLVRESLGTYDAHYESAIHYLLSNLGDNKRPAKIIGATATISSYQNQVRNLYNRKAIRFPCATPYVGKKSYTAENVYSFEDGEDLHRLVLGFTPFGRAIINSVVYAMKAMRVCVDRYRRDPSLVLKIPDIGLSTEEEALRVVEDYWIMLEYNNVKVDGNNVLNALDAPINVELADEGVPVFESKKMTGDDTFQDVRQTLAEVEHKENVFDGFNLIVATSMISHGVDADRFNNMMFFGVPGNMAEYIQAYSRAGRKHPGIVIDIMRPTREREISWQKNFVRFHEYKDILVDPVPINRWATRAIEQTLPGIFSALILNYYGYTLRQKREKLYLASVVQKAFEEGWITRTDVASKLYEIYGCTTNSTTVARGNQYREKIDVMLDEILSVLSESAFGPKDYIWNVLPWKVMLSLRDTDEGLSIRLI